MARLLLILARLKPLLQQQNFIVDIIVSVLVCIYIFGIKCLILA